MPRPLPDKAARRQAEWTGPIVAETGAAVVQGRPADHTLARLYRRHRAFGARDRRFFSDLVFAWFRWRGWLPTDDPALAAGLIAAHLLDATEIHPAIRHLAERDAWPHPLESWGACSLSEKARAAAAWRNAALPLDLRQVAPAWVAEALHMPAGADPAAHQARCLEAFQTRPPTWIHSRDSGRNPSPLPANVRRHPIVPGAMQVPDGATLDRLRHVAGLEFEIQDLASQCVGLLCAPQAGQRWWDVCAGAGGKSLWLAERLGARGALLATDVRGTALEELRRRAHRHRLRSLTTRQWNGETDPLPGRDFDGVLVDAPCSALGTWPRNPDARWRTTPADIARWADLQRRLLMKTCEAVKPGGVLVYATCTLTDVENGGVIRPLLAARSDFVLAPAAHPLTGEPTDGQIWIWPWQGPCNGMAIAVLRRVS